MTIKIEFPADRKDIALAIGQALVAIGQGKAVVNSPAPTTAAEVPAGAVEQHVATPASEDVARETSPTVDEQAAADMGNANRADQYVTHAQKEGLAHAASETDEKGVPFNGEFCGKAAIPFYGSGKKKGQWKKRQGVDEDAYDEWYADALLGARIEEEPEEQATEATSDSNVAANVFGSQMATPDENVPQDAGQLMKWVSEQQAAGNITQQQVTGAYTALQLPFDAVMNPAYPVADNCAAIYNHLKGQIG